MPEFTNGTRLKGGCKVQCKHCIEFTGDGSRIRIQNIHSIPMLALMQQEYEKRVQRDRNLQQSELWKRRPV